MRYPIRKKIRKVMNRSGTQVCPICKEKHILVEHHILGRDIPNANHPSNLAYICSNCHNKIHNGIVVIEGWFASTEGKTLLWHLKEEESFSGQNAKTYIM